MTRGKPFDANRVAFRFLQTTLPAFTHERATVLEWLLRLATAGAFIGHGAYGAIVVKPAWYAFFAELGLNQATVNAHSLVRSVGVFEMALGALALVVPIRSFLLFLFAWKIGTEFIWYPLTGKPAWEFVERWSNYTAPLALLIVRGWPSSMRDWFR